MSRYFVEPVFCPYCGTRNLKRVNEMPRCETCRMVFNINYCRQARKAPKSKLEKEA